MLLILVVLFKANNHPLESWPLWIQPNSLISVFTTLGRTAMMVPVASCISQLKWRHFHLRPNRLSHLQALDDASRGPWGSFMLLLTVRANALMAGALAVVSLIALGIDPAAQQILGFPQRETKLTNVTAGVGISTSYSSKAYLQDTNEVTGSTDFATMFNPDLFKLQSSIIDGIAGSVFQPMYSCPGARCSWEPFTTLGVCGEFRNMTDVVKTNCSGDTSYLLTCNYTFPSNVPIQYDDPDRPFTMSYAYQLGATSAPTMFFRSMGSGSYGGAALYTVKVVSGVDEMGSEQETPPPTHSYYSAWYWCARTYHNLTATPAGIEAGPITSEALVYTNVTTDVAGTTESYNQYMAPSTGTTYNITNNVDLHLFSYVGQLLGDRLIEDMYPHAGSNFDNDSLDLSYFLFTADIAKSTADLADTLTHQIRSNATGDNTNASMFSGTAFITETYIHVRWPWLILPLTETVLVAMLLVISILLTRGQPLLKMSVIAFLVHGIEGWTPEELEIRRPETAEKLEELSSTMRARFAEDVEGRLRFLRS
ncbi:hypothetical protein NKR23_g9547 [Pleurostoma richardsiae]|uniref:Uncharacterized protein n=1 Tax=Pleurostoma richardsiae TaxID=41990 RepID=A0AA38RF58_9PEZI|nr:hypothetical protein NKR23_g9547 [Pleurostoma richardsiae]